MSLFVRGYHSDSVHGRFHAENIVEYFLPYVQDKLYLHATKLNDMRDNYDDNRQ